jgi:hypothetical protein
LTALIVLTTEATPIASDTSREEEEMSTTHTEAKSAGDGYEGRVQPWRFRRTRHGRPRSLAWIVYAVLSLLGAIALLSNLGEFSFWVAEALLVLYTRYLYRGGRWVVFFFVW